MRLRALLSILLAFCMCSCGLKNGEADQIAIASLDSLFTSLYPNNEPGAAVLILRGDDIVYDKGFGLADLESGAKIDGNTFFNIASVSKQFTATAILKLAEEGKLSLDDNLKKYFSEYKSEFFNDIKLKHLMSHTSGIGDERSRENREYILSATDIESVQYIKDIKSLHFPPGSYYEYINPTYDLLGMVIEKVSGESFTDYMRENIFAPAQMGHTLYFYPNVEIPNMSHGYTPLQENNVALEDSDLTPEAIAAAQKSRKGGAVFGNWLEYDYGEEPFFATKADGGIYTSTHEFAKWELALRSGKIIGKKALSDAHTPKISVSDSPFSGYQRRQFTSYGYGWFIERVPFGFERIFHTGDNGGFQIYAGRYPASNLLLLVFANRNDKNRWETIQKVDSIMSMAGWIN